MNIPDVAKLVSKYCDGLNPAIVMSLIEHESSFNEKAEGKSKDKGLMQLTPIALKHLEQLGYDTSKDIFDAENNIQLGCAYLEYIYRTLKKHEVSTNIDFWVLCAYNGGITYILSCIKKKELPSNWNYAIGILSEVSKYKKFFRK